MDESRAADYTVIDTNWCPKPLEVGCDVAGFAGDRSIDIKPADQRENIRLDFLPEIGRIVAEHAPESQFEQGYDAGVYFLRLDLTQSHDHLGIGLPPQHLADDVGVKKIHRVFSQPSRKGSWVCWNACESRPGLEKSCPSDRASP